MEDMATHALRLIAVEPVDGNEPGGQHPSAPMQRLCQVAVRLVPSTGAAVCVVTSGGSSPQLVASCDGDAPPLAGLEQVTGSGPGLEAFATARTVLVPDLDEVEPGRWPGYAAAARTRRVRAVVAVPLRAGSVRLGALELYRGEPGPLGADAMAWADTLADIAVGLLLDASDADLPYRPEIFQAQGMVMVQLGVSLADAMLRLRAHAFATDRPLADVSRDIVARRLLITDRPAAGTGS